MLDHITFSFTNSSDDAILWVSTFFGDDGLKDLFCELYRHQSMKIRTTSS